MTHAGSHAAHGPLASGQATLATSSAHQEPGPPPGARPHPAAAPAHHDGSTLKSAVGPALAAHGMHGCRRLLADWDCMELTRK
jgi:hypothetical protein